MKAATSASEMVEPDFEYDVAFSFHSKDESLVVQLNDRLQERFRTFLYSEQQKNIAGTDGEATFNAVFGSKARIVVVLYRKEWGETPFTRIEQTAIRNRAYQEGYDFTFFIPTEKPSSTPKWLPKTRLYFGLERFGIDGAAGAIEARIQESGGEPTVETVADRAARLKRAMALRDQQQHFRRSEVGVKAALRAVDELIVALTSGAAEIASPLDCQIPN